MLTFKLLNVLLLHFTLTNGFTLPQEPNQIPGVFKIPRIRRETDFDVVNAKRKAFHKMGWPAPVGATHQNAVVSTHAHAQGRKQTGYTNTTPQLYHAEYLTPVSIGGQQLQIDFDTGSADFWVFSTYLSQQTIGQHIAFDPSKSRTFRNLSGETFEIMYGDGSGAEGVVGIDEVNIGGAIVQNLAIELATAVTEEFVVDTNNDGLMGFGFSAVANMIRPTPQKTFFERIQPSLAKPLFSVDLNEDGSGFYAFGEIPSKAYTGALTRMPVNSSLGLWEVPFKSYAINGKRVMKNGATPAVLDTGTSLLILEDDIVRSYWSTVPQAYYDPNYEGYLVPCTDNLPDFSIGLGPSNTMVNVSGHFFKYAQVDSTWCFGSLQSNEGYPLQILGDLLFRNAFVVFYGALAPGGPAVAIGKKSGS